jgi:RND superfamily putative drug exporter
MSNAQADPAHSSGAYELSATAKIATWSANHRWWVLGSAFLTIAAVVMVLANVETRIADGDSGGVGDSAIADRLLDERFGNSVASDRAPSHGPTELLVVSNPSIDADDPAFRAQVVHLSDELTSIPEVDSVTSYYDTGSLEMVSADGHAVLARVTMAAGDSVDNTEAALEVVREAREGAVGFELGMTGNLDEQIEEIVADDFSRILLVTMVLGLGILLIAFRAVVAAIVPLVMAISAIFTTIGVAAIVSTGYALDVSYSEMILLMGLAVGIDYSLFIVSRFRSERAAGRPRIEAISVASNTTGRAVFYAGVTVVVSLAGLMLTNNQVFISLALAAIIVVLITVIASLTLLPAILAVLGDKVNRLKLPVFKIGTSGGASGAQSRMLCSPARWSSRALQSSAWLLWRRQQPR